LSKTSVMGIPRFITAMRRNNSQTLSAVI
jgi:hypothetical protein